MRAAFHWRVPMLNPPVYTVYAYTHDERHANPACDECVPRARGVTAPLGSRRSRGFESLDGSLDDRGNARRTEFRGAGRGASRRVESSRVE